MGQQKAFGSEIYIEIIRFIWIPNTQPGEKALRKELSLGGLGPYANTKQQHKTKPKTPNKTKQTYTYTE